MRKVRNRIYSNLESVHDTFTGNWRRDAVAAVVMKDIDESAFREHPNYPKDFADWWRAQNSNTTRELL